MKRALIPIILAASLAGCADRPQVWRESEIQAIAEDAADDAAIAATDYEDRIAELESKVEALEKRIGTVSDLALSNYDAHESLRKTFNHNVDLDNKRRDAQRTARGECGYTKVAAGDGFIWQPNAC